MPNSTRKRPPQGWLRRSARRIRYRWRFSLSAVLFVVATLALVFAGVAAARALLLAFDAAALVFLTLAAILFSHADMAALRMRAKDEDGGRWGILLSSVAVSLVILVALGMELHGSKAGELVDIGLAASCIILAWAFFNTMFALHYAHEYYGDRPNPRKGLEFPGKNEPVYWDFAYFAFVIGMTFQVSDVQISGRHMRRIALVHSVIAFFFNVIILALTINLVAGKA